MRTGYHKCIIIVKSIEYISLRVTVQMLGTTVRCRGTLCRFRSDRSSRLLLLGR